MEIQNETKTIGGFYEKDMKFFRHGGYTLSFENSVLDNDIKILNVMADSGVITNTCIETVKSAGWELISIVFTCNQILKAVFIKNKKEAE